MIFSELEASVAGYRAHGMQPICVQDCDKLYKELIKIQEEVWISGFNTISPGNTIGEVALACNAACDKERPRSGYASDCRVVFSLNGKGQGDDRPIVTGTIDRDMNLPLEEGMVVVYKPEVRGNDGNYKISWGDTLVVRAFGAERLGSRSHGIWVA